MGVVKPSYVPFDTLPVNIYEANYQAQSGGYRSWGSVERRKLFNQNLSTRQFRPIHDGYTSGRN